MENKARFNLRRIFKWFVISVVSLVAAVFCLGAAAFLTLKYYPELGRINTFQEIKPGTPILGTNYSIEESIANSEKVFVLKNSATQKSMTFGFVENPYAPAAKYALLPHNQKLYFIVMVDNEGSASGWNFAVYNITTDEPHDVEENRTDLGMPWSCTYPRLDGNALEFENADHCDLFPILLKPISYHYIPLD